MKESGIVTAINQYLQYLENKNKLVYQRNNSGAFATARGGFYHVGKKGSPDFYIFLPNGQTIHLEVKNEKGRQSIGQLEFELKVKQLGHRYCVVRSVDEVEAIINIYIEPFIICGECFRNVKSGSIVYGYKNCPIHNKKLNINL